MEQKGQSGSALVLVLSIIVILTVLAGIILSAEAVQRRFIQRDVDRLQVLYAAEAGVFTAMHLLRLKPYWEVYDTVLTPAEGLTSTVSVEVIGGYYQIRSTAAKNRVRAIISATVAEEAPDVFDNAVYLWDTASRLNVAGSTVINGGVEAGRWGVRQSTFKGVRYTGRINGITRHNPYIKAPFFDDYLLQRSISRLDRIISAREDGRVYRDSKSTLEPVFPLPGELPVHFFDGDLYISGEDSLLLREPHIIVASGDLYLKGPLKYAAGSEFLAGKRMCMEGRITGENGLYYGRQSFSTKGPTWANGQFFSRGEIIVGDQGRLTFPSLLFVAGLDETQTGGIELVGRARVEGTIIHGFSPEQPDKVTGRVIVGRDARVTGGLFNPYETELYGEVHGTVLTYRFYFYQSPTRYINWLYDASIDVGLRPAGFVVPLRFNVRPDLKVIKWRVSMQNGGVVTGEESQL